MKVLLLFLLGIAVASNCAYHFFTAKRSDFGTEGNPEFFERIDAP